MEVAERHDPQHPRRNGLPRTDHLPQRAAPGARWARPICIGRHAFGDQYRATDVVTKGPGKLDHDLHRRERRAGRGKCTISKGDGVALCMYNTDASIRGFAHACFNMALSKKWPLYLSTKKYDSEKYDGRFKDIFEEIYRSDYKQRMDEPGTGLRTPADRRHGRFGAEMERRLRAGLQELRRRRAVGHCRAGLRLAGADDLGAGHSGRQDDGSRSGARHRDPPLPDAPAGRGDLDQPDRVDIRLDARSGAPCRTRRQRKPWRIFPARSKRFASRRSNRAR